MAQQNDWNLRCVTETPPSTAATVHAVCVFTGDNPTSAALDGVTFPPLAADETALLHLAGVPRLLLLGCGARAGFNYHTLRRVAGIAARQTQATRAGALCFAMPALGDAAQAVQAAVEGVIEGAYTNDFYRAKDQDAAPPLRHLALVVETVTDEVNAAMTRGRIIAESVNWARALIDEPGGSLPPQEFARCAAEMAAEFGLIVETLDADAIKQRGMGGLCGIGQGSAHPPALIVVRYEPPDATPDDELWAFVGKGITFDTGGISIKPPLKMEVMKSDMGGGAAALGALRALAQLKPRRRLVAIVPTAENMPSATSIKPGDIVNTLAGYTLEVVDTDAEGRVVLVDALAYAVQLGAARIVDLATLTGSIIVTLGTHRAGLFSNNDDWAAQVMQASENAGEPVWRMPVSDDYKKRIASDIADFKNYGGRPDAIAAALLLSKFVGETPWVHLDIAGTSWLDEATPYAPAGATGTGVRTLVELIQAEARV